MVCPKVWSVNTQSPTLEGWLSTPLGRRCIAAEQHLVGRVLERVFGEQLLQIGLWGGQSTFLRYSRTQRATLIDWRPDTGAQLRCCLLYTSDAADE